MTLTQSDLLLPVLPGGPREWETTDEALLEAASVTHPQSPFLLTTEAWEARERIAASRWYLLRNDQRERSRLTGRKESYYTCLGIERPWNGFSDLSAWVLQQLDPGNSEPTTAELVQALIGEWVDLGELVEIDAARARALATRIFLQSRGQIDIWGAAQRRLAERQALDRRERQRRELWTP